MPNDLTICGRDLLVLQASIPDASARLTVEIECGQKLVDGSASIYLKPCDRTRIRTEKGFATSPWVSIEETAQCLPVPEPSFGLMLAAGIFAALVAGSLSSARKRKPPAN